MVLDGVMAVATQEGVAASLVGTIFRELISDSVAQQARHLNRDADGRVPVAVQGTAYPLQCRSRTEALAGRGLADDLTGYRVAVARERSYLPVTWTPATAQGSVATSRR